ncbi:hypothetical protein SBFV2_gp38 [Sulfolobales Beppu filamentous virus 2]|uniref:Uncharacterized protein n=1 Tax=Sulfolobales Beppu filamentous virus 2 TaxID=2493123 RepID=A0A3S8NEZ3_9VIRU|nr:hypothetical protein HOU84_gp38 [Sulfolobales Beppu filamentous virus 2]AZI75805.1 hypothetical protein SBFV2_gp38 [Sulfolobales Beppu filamentous virus 2]
MSEANYYKGIFVVMPANEIEGEKIYYCFSCVVVGGEIDVSSNTVNNAEMIIGMMNNVLIIITPSEKILLGRDELYELLNGETSKVYGELPSQF